MASARPGNAQSIPYQREFAQSKAVVEKRLKELQASMAGQLPVLVGFAVPGDRPLERFRRGYYQCAAQVSSTSSGGSIVHVNAIITAWYEDPVSAKSGYQVLPSNGRLEADFLDRVQDSLGGQESASSAASAAQPRSSSASNHPGAPEQAVAAPPDSGISPVTPKTPASSPFKLSAPLTLNQMSSLATQKAVLDRHAEEQAKEAQGLEEILRNQAHPTNLVAVKHRDTPVLANPSGEAKVLFLAAAEDEFEILDLNSNWVHVRISGLSRGWIRRSSLEMPSADPVMPTGQTETGVQPVPANAQPFRIENEQVASFPGNWEPLKGKTVRIVSVQKAGNTASASGSGAKLAFAKSLLDHQYAGLANTSPSVAGVVVIFDSEDGGMMAATLPALRQWKEGTLSDEAFWRRCFFDPPDAFGAAANP